MLILAMAKAVTELKKTKDFSTQLLSNVYCIGGKRQISALPQPKFHSWNAEYADIPEDDFRNKTFILSIYFGARQPK